MNKKNSKKWVCPECGIITTLFYEYRKHQHVYAGPDQYMKSWSEREAKLDARIKELEETGRDLLLYMMDMISVHRPFINISSQYHKVIAVFGDPRKEKTE